MATMRGVRSAPKSSLFFSNSIYNQQFCHSERSRGISCYDCTEREFRDASPSLSMTRMKARSLIFLPSILLPALALGQPTPQSLTDAELPSLLAIYKDIHAHPELSMHEERSAAIVAKELKAAGCDVTERFGKYDKPG